MKSNGSFKLKQSKTKVSGGMSKRCSEVREAKLSTLPLFHTYKPSKKNYFATPQGFREFHVGVDNLRFNKPKTKESATSFYFEQEQLETFAQQGQVSASPAISGTNSGLSTARGSGPGLNSRVNMRSFEPCNSILNNSSSFIRLAEPIFRF